jgi:succinyl-CoA synthetase beta subunit
MNIHEYQGKEILRSYGVSVPVGKPAFSVEEAANVAKELDSKVIVVKAQIHAGGRGKAGGVKIAKSIDEVKNYDCKAAQCRPYFLDYYHNTVFYLVSLSQNNTR